MKLLLAERAKGYSEVLTGWRFGRFAMKVRERRLEEQGKPVPIGSRCFDVLRMLVEADGGLVTKDAILSRVWPDVVVEENNLQVQVSTLRRVFRDDRDWIVTIPGRGYRFVAPIAPLPEDDAPRPETDAPIAATPDDPKDETACLSIAVLPFSPRGDDPARSWFTDGITDGLVADLSQHLSAGTVVAGENQARRVRFVVEGSVLLTRDRARVSAQLKEQATGVSRWAERFDMVRADLLQLQDDIIARLSRIAALQIVHISALDSGATYPHSATSLTHSGHAYAHGRRTKRASVQAAAEFYRRALQLEPDRIEALVGLADLMVSQVVNGVLEEGRADRDEAGRAAMLTEAEAILARALDLSPGHLPALKSRVVMLRARGSFAESLAAAAGALTRTPSEPVLLRETGLNLMYLGRPDEAVTWLRHADSLAPTDPAR